MLVGKLILRAAVRLRSDTDGATRGPWEASPVTSPDSHATSAVYSHAHPTGTGASEVVASGRIQSGYGGIRHPGNAVYMARMHPPVGYAIVDLLEQEGGAAIGEFGAARMVGETPEEITAMQRKHHAAAIKLALEILREDSPWPTDNPPNA